MQAKRVQIHRRIFQKKIRLLTQPSLALINSESFEFKPIGQTPGLTHYPSKKWTITRPIGWPNVSMTGSWICTHRPSGPAHLQLALNLRHRHLHPLWQQEMKKSVMRIVMTRSNLLRPSLWSIVKMTKKPEEKPDSTFARQTYSRLLVR